jgi:tRNA pseudouridine38-40 synthase
MRVRLTIEYDGTDYHGWQRQPTAATIQSTVEAAIQRIGGTRTAAVAAGRTDAGVHAAAQTVHFDAPGALTPDAWRRALNAVLPPDIKVVAAHAAPEAFHARHSASGKHYRYRLLNRQTPSPLERRTSWHVSPRLDLPAMRRAAKALVGVHDFRAFEGADPSRDAARDSRCRISRCAIRTQGDLVVIDVVGTRFLKHMVRNIVGTLVEVGLARRPAADVARILASGDRRLAGVTAPPHGLTLMSVQYGRRAKAVRERRGPVSGRSPERYTG